MNVLVTGGAGYIGSHTVLALIEAGHHVTVFDDLSSGHEENLPPKAHFVLGDISDTPSLKRLLSASQYDAVMHFAALKAAGESMEAPQLYAAQNTAASLQLLHQVLHHQIPYFVFSSSAAVYGEPEALPIHENHPKKPTNYYGFTKLQIEQNLHWFSQLKGLRYASLRYFNAAGYDLDGRITRLERGSYNLIPILMEVAVGKRSSLEIFGNDYPTPDGTCIRDYVHVTDLAQAHCLALDYLARENQDLEVNLGTGRGHSVMEVLASVRKMTGQTIAANIAPRRPGDPAMLFAASDKAGKLMHWQPEITDLDTLVDSTWQVYKRSYLKG